MSILVSSIYFGNVYTLNVLLDNLKKDIDPKTSINHFEHVVEKRYATKLDKLENSLKQ